MKINDSGNKINLPVKTEQKKRSEIEEWAIQNSIDPKDLAFIGQPKIMREGTMREGFSLGLGAAIDPIGLAVEGWGEKDLHENSTRTVAEHIVKGNPKKYDLGTDSLIGLGAGIAVGIAINVATRGTIPLITGLVDGLANIPRLFEK